LQRLDVCVQKRVTVLTAGAGYGKTYLLSYWASAKDSNVCWLSLGDDANSPLRFWEYFIASVHEGYAEFPVEKPEALMQEKESFLNKLINSLAELPSGVLIMDDVHTIDNDELLEALRYLCLNLPENFHLILSGRELRFSLAKLAAEEELCVIGKDELAFSREEISALAELRNVQLSSCEAEHLLEKTEGWPAGISLILLSMSKGMGAEEAIKQAGGAASFVSDYFGDELFSALDPKTIELLSKVCVFPYITAEACDYLFEKLQCGGVNSSELLYGLWKQNLFIEQLPNNIYKLHQLLREVLLNRLRMKDRALYARLFDLAAAWYEACGDYATALELLFSQGSYERAGAVLERNYSKIVADGELYLLRRWLDRLPESLVKSSPKLQLAAAWSLFPSGRAAEAEKYLSDATKQLLGTENDSIVSCEIAALRALNCAILQYDPDESLQHSREALRMLEKEANLSVEMSSLLSSGVSHLLQSEPKEAEAAFARILTSQENKGSVFFSFFGKYYYGVLEQKKGHLSRSAKYYNDAIELTRNETGKEHSVASLAHISLARIYYEWNRLDDCLRHVQTGLDLAGEWSLPSNAVNAYHTLSLVSQLKGDVQTALTAARLSYDFADGSSYATPYITYESLMSLRQKAASPVMGSSIDWAGNYLLALNRSIPIQGEALWHVPAAVQLAIASGEFKDPSFFLDELLSGTSRVGFNQQVIETQILRALLFREQGKPEKALLALANALEFAQYEGYTRIFLDEGQPMLELLQQAREKHIVPAYTGKLLTAFQTQKLPEKQPQPASKCPLSARELEVLRELAKGKVPKEISETLFISIGTTRCHLHNIYEKLGAVNQVQAVRIAREQNWI